MKLKELREWAERLGLKIRTPSSLPSSSFDPQLVITDSMVLSPQ